MKSSWISASRLLIGLFQGLALYSLFIAEQNSSWPATVPMLFVPFCLIAFFLPILFILNLGSLRTKNLIIWGLVFCLLIALGDYDVARRGAAVNTDLFFSVAAHRGAPTTALIFFLCIGLFISQSLVSAGAAEGRLLASYPRYFDTAWKLAIQLNFSISFTLFFWLILFMGAKLLKLIAITFMEDLLTHDWFTIPATVLAFAYALHITDVNAGLVRGIRTLKLTLLSWLLPIMVAFVAIFLVSVPLKGIDLLWATHHTSQILLGATAWLILLLNAAYQDGLPVHTPGKILKYSGWLGSLLPLPMILIAFYAVYLRINEHGWTVHLIEVFCCLLVALFYSVGYCAAAISSGPWLKRLEQTNIYTSFVILLLLLCLFSPIADPARLSVADQMSRLESGKVSVDKFDFAYLKFHGEAYGIEALHQLKDNASGPSSADIMKKADWALNLKNEWDARRSDEVKPGPEQITKNITVYPAGRTLPDSFLKKNWASTAPHAEVKLPCFFNPNAKCEAYIIDAPTGTPQEIILSNALFSGFTLFNANGDDWVPAGNFSSLINCKGVREALRAGAFKMQPSMDESLAINGMQIHVNQFENCPGWK